MPKFTVHSSAYATATSLKSIARMSTLTVAKIELVYLYISGSGSQAPNPTDLQHEFSASFLDNTGAGSMTAYIPALADETSAAARGTYHVNAAGGGEPTAYRTNPFLFGGFNQRIGATFGMPEGEGFPALANATSGFRHMGVRVRSSLAHVVDLNAHMIEP
jgi:hypothetical protein